METNLNALPYWKDRVWVGCLVNPSGNINTLSIARNFEFPFNAHIYERKREKMVEHYGKEHGSAAHAAVHSKYSFYISINDTVCFLNINAASTQSWDNVESTFIQCRIYMDARSWRCIDVNVALYKRHVPAGNFLKVRFENPAQFRVSVFQDPCHNASYCLHWRHDVEATCRFSVSSVTSSIHFRMKVGFFYSYFILCFLRKNTDNRRFTWNVKLYFSVKWNTTTTTITSTTTTTTITNNNNSKKMSPAAVVNGAILRSITNTVDSRYLEFQGTHWNTLRYPYLDISELREWRKQ